MNVQGNVCVRGCVHLYLCRGSLKYRGRDHTTLPLRRFAVLTILKFIGHDLELQREWSHRLTQKQVNSRDSVGYKGGMSLRGNANIRIF